MSGQKIITLQYLTNYIRSINHKMSGADNNRRKKYMNNTIEKLTKFVNQRPGLDFCNYGDGSAYRSEMAEITRDRTDFFELLSFAFRRIDNLNEQLTAYLSKDSGRLTLNKDGQLEYCTGQYFPTEYRPAANRVLANLIFASYRDEIEANTPNNVYKDGHEIRKAIKRNVSRRLARNYFN